MATAAGLESKRLEDIRNEFERGVFLVVYGSRKQKNYRLLAVVMLSLKHVMRGLLFSCPLYLLALAAYSIPGASSWLFLLLLLPAVYVSWVILSRGIKEDYHHLVEGYLLRPGFLRRMIFHGKT